MNNEIQENLVYLVKHLTNLETILIHLLQAKVISQNESDKINHEATSDGRNTLFLQLLQKRDWEEIRQIFLGILSKTNNEHCVKKFEETPRQTRSFSGKTILKSKWWQNKKPLIKSLYKRKVGDKLLVEELQERLSKDEDRMIVIFESADAQKLTGMGGVGKTLTAKWYAHHYELEYDHIIWIDCGEGSIFISFKDLARDLDVKNRNELTEVHKLATKCFEILSQYKCLWIYDNAECYQGNEGILDVLPKYQEKFYFIITSRSREWGTKNIGFGKISDLELDIFNQTESLDFLKIHLIEDVSHTDDNLTELCRLLGNLPLALQLAVAALNNGQINLKNYIEKSSADDVGNVVDAKFDDYEKKINKNFKISLDLIKTEKYGDCALKMLMIFGYVRPDDISSNFIKKITNLSSIPLKMGIQVLEKYSLISKTGKRLEYPYEEGFWNKLFGRNEIKMEMDLLSIHRLLQQVIRHNGQKTEKETLRKILGCKGFIDLKFVPFTKYADENLKKEFPEIKAELLDQQQLQKLLNEKRFEDALKLAQFIDEELKTSTTKYNYAVCLDLNGQLEEAERLVSKLEYSKHMKRDENYKQELLDLKSNPSPSFLLFLSTEKLKKLLNENRQEEAVNYAKAIDDKLNTSTTKYNYAVCLHKNGQLEAAMTLINDVFPKEPNKNSFITAFERIHNYLAKHDLKLHPKGDWKIKIKSTEFQVGLILFHYFLGLGKNEVANKIGKQICNTDLLIWMLTNAEIPHFVLKVGGDRSKLKLNEPGRRIELKNTSIGMSQYSIDIDYLILDRVRVSDWKESKWNVDVLKLYNVYFVEKTQMSIKEITVGESSLDISCLPSTTQKLTIRKTEISCNGTIELPLLKCLILVEMDNISCLSLFNSIQLTQIYFFYIEEVNVDLLPKSVKEIKINRSTIVTGGVRKLDKLILEDFSFDEVKQVLNHLPTNHCYCHDYYYPNEVVELVNKGINTVAISVDWTETDFNESNLSILVDRQSEFYLFEEGRGKAIAKEEFDQLLKPAWSE